MMEKTMKQSTKITNSRQKKLKIYIDFRINFKAIGNLSNNMLRMCFNFFKTKVSSYGFGRIRILPEYEFNFINK